MKMSQQRAILLVMCLASLSTAAGAAETHRGWTTNTDQPSETDKVASLNQNPEQAAGLCDLDQKYNVVGFSQNSNDLTATLKHRLDQVVADIGDRHCTAQLIGYSSHEGGIASNALFAVERAQNSLKYLQERGVKFVKASAAGVGATNEFGPDFRSNRRVVITVTP